MRDKNFTITFTLTLSTKEDEENGLTIGRFDAETVVKKALYSAMLRHGPIIARTQRGK